MVPAGLIRVGPSVGPACTAHRASAGRNWPAGPHSERRPRRSLRGDTGPGSAPTACVQARGAGPAVTIQSGDPAPRRPEWRPGSPHVRHSERCPRRSLRGDIGPGSGPTAYVQARGAGPAVAIQSGDPTPRRPEWQPAIRDVRRVSGPLGPARTAVRDSGRHRTRLAAAAGRGDGGGFPAQGCVDPGGAPRPGPLWRPRSGDGGAPRPGRRRAGHTGGTARPQSGRDRWRRCRSRSTAQS